jgi:transglutaminase-like putative cysteine protease
VATIDSSVGARNTDFAQALTLAGLLAGASLSLSRLFVGPGWVPAVWLSMACALGLSALLRRFGVGQLLSLLAMVAGFILVTGVLLFPETLLVVIPTGDTFAAMARATSDALRGISDQAAPVGVTREFLFLTCAGAWAVTVAADGLAFRARQPLLALMPVLGLFVFPALIRDTSPAWYAAWFLLGAGGLLLFESRARLATWGRWVSSPRARPGSGWRLPLTRANSIGRWMLAAAALLALTFAWLLPGYGQRAVLDYRSGPNGSAAIAINPFVSLKTRLTSDENVPVFDVRTSQPSYYRLITLDRFDGVQFTPSSPGQLVPFAGDTSQDLDGGAPTSQVTHRFTIRGLAGQQGYLPAAQAPVTVRASRSQVFQSPTNRDLTLRRPLRSGLSYTVVSRVPTPTAADLAGPKSYDDVAGLRPYLDAANIDPRVQSLALSLTQGKDGPFAKALAIQDYLRSPAFKYSLDVPALSQGGNQLRRFLTEVRAGYCEQFAAAMAAMARAAGIPSRVAVGFTSGVPAGDHWEVGSKDAHAWPELFFPGVGWVRFEPTPRGDGQVDVPSYTTPTGRLISPTTTASTAPAGNASATTQSNGNPKLEAENTDSGAQLGSPESGREKFARRGLLALIVLLALVALVPAAKVVRVALARRRAARRPRDAVAGAYDELTGWASDAGIGRRGAETPAAYAKRMSGQFAADAGPLEELTELYVTAEYAPREPAGEDASAARKLARSARGRLAGRLGWRRRVGAVLSPRSLIPPQRPRREHAASGSARR